jgi:hypothetical protein
MTWRGEKSCSYWDLKPDFLAFHSVASHYTECYILADSGIVSQETMMPDVFCLFRTGEWQQCPVSGSRWWRWPRYRAVPDSAFCLWYSICSQCTGLSHVHSKSLLTEEIFLCAFMFHCGTYLLLFYFHEVTMDLFYFSDVLLKTILHFIFIDPWYSTLQRPFSVIY